MYEYKAEVVNVVDGDTVDCIIQVGFHMTAKIRIRLSGIDAPEPRGATREAGRTSALFLEGLVLGKEVTLRTFKADSFGRWLGILYLKQEDDVLDINQVMVRVGMAVPYSTSRGRGC